ncbi:DUF4838 domain-containing protein, partial [candidate division KSB1 bacterium]|nr:DUF4838 domain-containing protein [candidate division KSB1 bacterium]
MKIHFLILAIGVSVTLWNCSANKIKIVTNGSSNYKIVKPVNATAAEEKAAAELQRYLCNISGVEIPVVTDDAPVNEFEILIGRNAHLQNGDRVKWDELGADGFVIQTSGATLILAGGAGKGTLYAVYGFLEDYLGCRMYAPDALSLPHNENIIIDKTNDAQVPYFTWRETLHYLPNVSQDYADWHKLHNREDSRREWGMWVHTFDDLVPAELYYADHPDYFSELNGIRMRDGQLCLSNPDVLQLTIANLKKMMLDKPEATYWSVSQNDNYNYCTCEKCKELDEKYGSHAGSLLAFVNQIAEQFPDKVISTLAYQYTRQAPIGLRPADNVNIMLCSIECNRSQPLATDPGEASFRQDVEDWGRLTDNILVWDYVVQFRNYLNPFPNLHVLQPNLQFFRDNNCRLMFQQGSGSSISELHELRTYLIAKLLWDPDIDLDVVRKDFLNGYYGAAAPFIEKYIEKTHKALLSSGERLDIYGYPYDAVDSYLRPELLQQYEVLFDRAETAVSGDKNVLKRVRRARLPIEFAILDISLHDVNQDLSFVTHHDGKILPKKEMLARLERFVQVCHENGIERLEEHGYSPDQFRENCHDYIEKIGRRNLAYGKPVTVLTQCSEKYPVGGGSALTDGRFGLIDYHYNWLGFEGADLQAIIDLGEVKDICELRADFMQHPLDWIFLPKWVDFALSIDGATFEQVAHLTHAIPQDRGKIYLHTFHTSVNTRARYIKITAESLKQCPAWHRGAGQPAWIFIDEV